MSLSVKHTLAAISVALSGYAQGQPVGAAVAAVQQGVQTHLSTPHHANLALTHQAQENAKKQREQALKILQDIQRNNEVLRLQGEKMRQDGELRRLRAEKEKLEWEARRKDWDSSKSIGHRNNNIGSPIAPYTSMSPLNAMSTSPQARETILVRKPIGLVLGDTKGDQGAYVHELTPELVNRKLFQIGDTIVDIDNSPIMRTEQVLRTFQNISPQGLPVKVVVLRQDRIYYEIFIPRAFFFQRG